MVNHVDHTPPDIDYLAKDYASFRRLMLDHLSQLVPDWREQSPADLGHALVEVLAYAADSLSYYQDAVATEAYLGTARLRRSVRRHVRPLEYYLQEGCNARAWVQIQVKKKLFLPIHTQLLIRLADCEGSVIRSDEAAYHQALEDGVPVFETMHHIYLMPHHNEIPILSTGREHCLPKGSTAARLKYEWKPLASENLRVGDVLVFEELCDAQTGTVNPDHRHAVRLLKIEPHKIEPQQSEAGSGIDVIDVKWAAADALPFDLCPASVARGNIVLVDHGRTIHEQLPAVAPDERYRPRLRLPDLTFAAPFDSLAARKLPACQAMQYQPYEAFASVQLRQYAAQFAARNKGSREPRLLPSLHEDSVTLPPVTEGWEVMVMAYHWTLRRDLLNSGPFDRDFQVEMEEGRQAYLRFGFGGTGKLPEPGDRFVATYRAGNGSRGNVGAETIAHVVVEDVEREHELEGKIKGVRNPMPARGGCDPEEIESARLHAPYAYRTQKACVTAADYARRARQHPAVVHAAAHWRSVGQGPRIVISVQGAGGQPVDEAFQQELRATMEPFRLMGHDLAIEGPRYVPVRMQLRVYLSPGANAAIVHQALHKALGEQIWPDGEVGFFYPDRFDFGQSIHQSQVIARAMAVPGVRRVEMVQFTRAEGEDDVAEIEITVGPGEIACLDRLDLTLEGSP
jgi:hypothetical protein